jgi:hypothetical protein
MEGPLGRLAAFFVRYVPEECREAHKLFAKQFHYFWLPCPLCGTFTGGHEWRDIDGKPSSIPDPDGDPSVSIGICPTCTRAGHGHRAQPAETRPSDTC